MTADDWTRRRTQLLTVEARLERRLRFVTHPRYPAAAPGVDRPDDARAEIVAELAEITDELIAMEQEHR